MNVKTWETSSQTAIVSCSKNYPLSKKGTYRCKIAATVICNGKTEKVSKTSGSVKASMKELGSMAKGLHALCGYSTGVYLTSDMGAVMTAKLKRGVSVKEAFFATAKETQTWKSKLKSRQACVFTTKKCANDRIWGYGSVASDPKDYNKDPSGYVKYCYNL